LPIGSCKEAVREHGAQAASAVILDARTGEVLALVNQPAFNPNGDRDAIGDRRRNRAVVDVFEPGSTMKPFTVALALEQGTATPDRLIDTRPGTLQVGRHQVRDIHNLGVADVRTVIRKSSNVGVAVLALELAPERMWGFFRDLGFGASPGSGFVGEREAICRTSPPGPRSPRPPSPSVTAWRYRRCNWPAPTR
jgi:cell division protein FtsI (penicillin-binding protein 3)